jgi:hypothetical protein
MKPDILCFTVYELVIRIQIRHIVCLLFLWLQHNVMKPLKKRKTQQFQNFEGNNFRPKPAG